MTSARYALALSTLLVGCKADEKPLCVVEDSTPSTCSGGDCADWGTEWWSTTANEFRFDQLAVGPEGEVAVLRGDEYVVLLNADGSERWRAPQDLVMALAFAPDGDVLAVSYGDDLKLIRYDADGTMLWSYVYENPVYEPKLVVDDAGTAWMEAELNDRSAIVGVDRDGVEVALLRPEDSKGRGLRYIGGLEVAPDGFTLVVTGSTGNPHSQRTAARSTADSSSAARSSGGSFFAQGLDANGNRQWSFQTTTEHVVPGPCGSFFGVSGGYRKPVLQRLDTDGTVLWERPWLAPAYDSHVAWNGGNTLYAMATRVDDVPVFRFHVNGTRSHSPIRHDADRYGAMGVRPDGGVVTGANEVVTSWRK